VFDILKAPGVKVVALLTESPYEDHVDFDYDDEYDHLKSSSNVLVAVSRILSRGTYVDIPKTYLINLKSNIITFVNLLSFIGKSKVDNDNLEQVKELSTSIKGVSLILAQGNYNKVIPKAWMDSVRTNLMSFSQMIKSFDSGGFLSMFSDSTSEKVTELANGIIELAKIFNENKVPFDVKKVPSLQWSQGFSTALSAIMPGLNYISQNDGLLSSGEDKFKSGVNAIVDSIVSISLKLSKGKFDKTLNVNFFKNLSDSTQSYINMTKSLESADLNYESVSDMADSMVELAKAYDRLSDAMGNLNGQLGSVDMERMTMLKNLSGSIVMLSLMDSTQFEKMMTSLESKAKIFVDLMKDTEKSATAGMEKTATKPVEVKPGTKAASPSTVKTPQQTQKQSAEDAMSKLASAISGLQGQVAVIANVIGGGGGNTSLQEYMENRMKKDKTGLSN
jgi:LEA14-like dessication related protein